MKESQRNKRVSSLFERNAVIEAQSRFEQWEDEYERKPKQQKSKQPFRA